jgi:hypothetical protein
MGERRLSFRMAALSWITFGWLLGSHLKSPQVSLNFVSWVGLFKPLLSLYRRAAAPDRWLRRAGAFAPASPG